MDVYAATKNLGKLHELQSIAAPLGWRIVTYAAYRDVDEVADSYAGNAWLKARALMSQLQAASIRGAVLGDDSGLEIRALDKRPGIYSARYGPPGSSWPEKRRLLLAEIAASGDVDRSARFVCAIALLSSSGLACEGIGTVDGRIPEVERGEGGFSYDAIFEYAPLAATFAELAPALKNGLSHRAVAVAAAAAALARMETAAFERRSDPVGM